MQLANSRVCVESNVRLEKPRKQIIYRQKTLENNCIMFDPISTIFMFHVTKPTQSTLLKYRSNWIQTQQLSKLCIFLPSFLSFIKELKEI